MNTLVERLMVSLELLEKLEESEEIDVDEAVTASAPLYRLLPIPTLDLSSFGCSQNGSRNGLASYLIFFMLASSRF